MRHILLNREGQARSVRPGNPCNATSYSSCDGFRLVAPNSFRDDHATDLDLSTKPCGYADENNELGTLVLYEGRGIDSAIYRPCVTDTGKGNPIGSTCESRRYVTEIVDSSRWQFAPLIGVNVKRLARPFELRWNHREDSNVGSSWPRVDNLHAHVWRRLTSDSVIFRYHARWESFEHLLAAKALLAFTRRVIRLKAGSNSKRP